jgi:hypothetical protein
MPKHYVKSGREPGLKSVAQQKVDAMEHDKKTPGLIKGHASYGKHSAEKDRT